jgi:hypothetical protein
MDSDDELWTSITDSIISTPCMIIMLLLLYSIMLHCIFIGDHVNTVLLSINHVLYSSYN